MLELIHPDCHTCLWSKKKKTKGIGKNISHEFNLLWYIAWAASNVSRLSVKRRFQLQLFSPIPEISRTKKWYENQSKANDFFDLSDQTLIQILTDNQYEFHPNPTRIKMHEIHRIMSISFHVLMSLYYNQFVVRDFQYPVVQQTAKYEAKSPWKKRNDFKTEKDSSDSISYSFTFVFS